MKPKGSGTVYIICRPRIKKETPLPQTGNEYFYYMSKYKNRFYATRRQKYWLYGFREYSFSRKGRYKFLIFPDHEGEQRNRFNWEDKTYFKTTVQPLGE